MNMNSITISDWLLKSVMLKVSMSAKNVALVIAGAFYMFVCAQVIIPLPFTPVALSLTTFASLSLGVTYGAKRALLSAGLWFALGLIGAPVYQGMHSASGSLTTGYALGCVAAAGICGFLAKRDYDKSYAKMLGAMFIGEAIIYIFGVGYLMYSLGITDLVVGLNKGFVPFIIGDLIKMAVVTSIIPSVWRIIKSHK